VGATSLLQTTSGEPLINATDDHSISCFSTATRDQPHSEIESGIITSTMSAQTPKKRSAARKKPKRDTTPGLPKQPKQDPTPGPPKQPKHDPTSGLLKDVLETFSPPVLEGSERYVVPEDLVYIGSYNWVETPNPTIIVPG